MGVLPSSMEIKYMKRKPLQVIITERIAELEEALNRMSTINKRYFLVAGTLEDNKRILRVLRGEQAPEIRYN